MSSDRRQTAGGGPPPEDNQRPPGIPDRLWGPFNGLFEAAQAAEMVRRILTTPSVSESLFEIAIKSLGGLPARLNAAVEPLNSITVELMASRPGAAVFGGIIQPTAHQVTYEWCWLVVGTVWGVADKLRWLLFQAGEAEAGELDLGAVRANVPAVAEALRAVPDIFVQLKAEMAIEMARCASQQADRDDGRITFDDDTQTVTLDGTPHLVTDLGAYKFLRELYRAHRAGETPIGARVIAGRVEVSQDNYGRTIDRLPRALRALIHSKPGTGISFKYPV
jgi:hypothetical protein